MTDQYAKCSSWRQRCPDHGHQYIVEAVRHKGYHYGQKAANYANTCARKDHHSALSASTRTVIHLSAMYIIDKQPHAMQDFNTASLAVRRKWSSSCIKHSEGVSCNHPNITSVHGHALLKENDPY